MRNLIEMDFSFNLIERQEDLLQCVHFKQLN